MKIPVVKKYGNPEEVVEFVEAQDPVPSKDEVLVRIKATAVNDYDWSLTSGKPFLYRVFFGLRKPRKKHGLGMEFAGVIEALGEGVTNFQLGDEVYGDTSDFGFGCFGELVAVNVGCVNEKPSFISFEEATALPHAGLLAWQGLVTKGKLRKGQKILINGGGGGVGMLGLQIAKAFSCDVTGVDTGPKLQTMLDKGYDRVIDYKTDNFTKNGELYDLVLDCRSDKSPWAYKRSLQPGGVFVTVGGKPGVLLRLLFFGRLATMFSSKRLKILGLKPNQGLNELHKLIQAGKLEVVIDGPHHLADAATQIQRFGDGVHTGKIVLLSE